MPHSHVLKALWREGETKKKEKKEKQKRKLGEREREGKEGRESLLSKGEQNQIEREVKKAQPRVLHY